ncbi:hypothetical protein K1719_030597 [Acacia pycnantha]|nr:hypothetical protein K1719_030597 [Acacia pycnantha]
MQSSVSQTKHKPLRQIAGKPPSSGNMSGGCRGKDSWPGLVGEGGQRAEATIERENRWVKVIIVVEGSFVTADFRCDRVRVWVNRQGSHSGSQDRIEHYTIKLPLQYYQHYCTTYSMS